jgi:anti-sigma factor ChrR (cupin superfamily)
VVAHGRALAALAGSCLEAVFPHQSDHARAAHVLVLLDQIFVNVRGLPSAVCFSETPPAQTLSGSDRHWHASIRHGAASGEAAAWHVRVNQMKNLAKRGAVDETA